MGTYFEAHQNTKQILPLNVNGSERIKRLQNIWFLVIAKIVRPGQSLKLSCYWKGVSSIKPLWLMADPFFIEASVFCLQNQMWITLYFKALTQHIPKVVICIITLQQYISLQPLFCVVRSIHTFRSTILDWGILQIS